ERRIVSLQIEIENAIENQIFARILSDHNITERVDFQWGQLSTAQQGDKIKKITFLLQNPYLDPSLRKSLEFEIASLLNVTIIHDSNVKTPPKVSNPNEPEKPDEVESEEETIVFNVLQKSDV
ncbi:MAG: hypothetical protein AABY22_29800, partial [Nanoarchaeota archaeon]